MSFFNILFQMYANYKQGGPLLKVVILGDMAVGKTCLMRRLVHNVFDFNSAHTIGVDFLTKEMTLEGDEFTLQVRQNANHTKINKSHFSDVYIDLGHGRTGEVQESAHALLQGR